MGQKFAPISNIKILTQVNKINFKIWYILFHIKKIWSSIMKNKTTKRKQQIVSYQDFINSETGEVEKFKVINEEEYSDFNFHKVWLKQLCDLFEALGGGKNTILAYLLRNMNYQNTYIGSIAEIAKKTDISVNTVKSTLKILKVHDYIRMVQQGVYKINPNLIAKGKSNGRQMQVSEYYKIGE